MLQTNLVRFSLFPGSGLPLLHNPVIHEIPIGFHDFFITENIDNRFQKSPYPGLKTGHNAHIQQKGRKSQAAQKHLPDQPSVNHSAPGKGKQTIAHPGSHVSVFLPVNQSTYLSDALPHGFRKPPVHPVQTDILSVARKNGFPP